ncbi:MAG: hypothetical protein ACOZAG_00355 [Patescibacteria group bacterium]
MDKNIEKISENFNLVDPPPGLFDKIMCRIEKERKILTLRRRIIIFSIGLVGSAIAFIPALAYVRTGLVESGFSAFFSLIFSDTEIVLVYWKNFAQSLLETLPVAGLAVFLATIAVFLESLKMLVRDLKNFYNSKQLRKA